MKGGTNVAEDYDLTRVRAAFALALAIRRQTKGRVYATVTANLFPEYCVGSVILHGAALGERQSLLRSLGPVQYVTDVQGDKLAHFFRVTTAEGVEVSTNYLTPLSEAPPPLTVSAEDKAQAESVVQG